MNIGGIGKYVTNLSKALKKRGHTVFVASSGGELEKVLSCEGIKHIHLDIKTKSELSPKVLKSFFALKSFVDREGIDLVHAHTRVAQVAAGLLSLSRKIPYVTTCHGFFEKRLGRRIFGCWGEKVIAISEAVKNQLVHDFGVEENKIATVHTGIELERFIDNMPSAKETHLKRRWNLNGAFVVGTIGRLSFVKGQDTLLKAAKELIRDRSDMKFLLVGDGPEEKRLKILSKALGLDNNVVFTGSVDDTKEAIRAMDIFVLPSRKEGLGLSLVEAMASGKPCIGTRVGGIVSLIEEGVTGLLVEPDDHRGLAKAIKYISDNKEKADLFKKAAQKRVAEDFTIDKMVSRIEETYEEVISGRSNGHGAWGTGHGGEGKRVLKTEELAHSKKLRKKILIFNVNWLGDAIFSSPLIRAVREAFPASYMACIVPPRCKEILEANTRINELIIFDENGPEKSLLGKIKFALKLRKRGFDIAFILHRSLTRALITYIGGIRIRVGYDTKGRGFLLTKKLSLPENELHRVEHFLRLAKAMGIGTSKKDYEFFITEPDRKKAGRILESEGLTEKDDIVAVNPGGNWDPKRWPVGNFAELADRLIERYGVKVLITGAEKDRNLAEGIMRNMNNRPISLCGRTSLRELASIFERAKLVVSGDSGPMHIAVSVGTNVVALFGPTSADITGPYGSGNYTVIRKDIGCNAPCYDLSCKDNRCMKAVTVDDVIGAIEEKRYLY